MLQYNYKKLESYIKVDFFLKQEKSFFVCMDGIRNFLQAKKCFLQASAKRDFTFGFEKIA